MEIRKKDLIVPKIDVIIPERTIFRGSHGSRGSLPNPSRMRGRARAHKVRPEPEPPEPPEPRTRQIHNHCGLVASGFTTRADAERFMADPEAFVFGAWLAAAEHP
jgi:hypothetical protein